MPFQGYHAREHDRVGEIASHRKVQLPPLVERMAPVRPDITCSLEWKRDESESDNDAPLLVVADRGATRAFPHPRNARPGLPLLLYVHSIGELRPHHEP